MKDDDLVSRRVRYFRNLLRLSQEFVAGELKMDQSGYSRIEGAKSEFRASHLRILANLLRARIEDFFLPFGTVRTPQNKRDTQDFVLPRKLFRIPDEESMDSSARSAAELLVWSADKANAEEFSKRRALAKRTRGRFRTIDEAWREYGQTIKSYARGALLINVYDLAMQEFGLWVSWNLFGPFSGMYVPAGTEVSGGSMLGIPLVGINSAHPIESQRFAVAHQIAHHLLGHEIKVGCLTKGTRDATEKEADEFAARVVMRESLVKASFALSYIYKRKHAGTAARLYFGARVLQVHYRVLVNRVISLGLIPAEERTLLLHTKLADLQTQFHNADVEEFTEEDVNKSEGLLRQTGFYRQDQAGGPQHPQDLRFLQDYAYVGYLKRCDHLPPVEPSLAYEQTAKIVAATYPRYVAEGH